MKPRVVSVIGLLSFVALFSFAKEPDWARKPGTPVTLSSSGFELRTVMPHGWSFTTEKGFAPPAGLASSCRFRNQFHTEGGWDGLVVRGLRATDATLVGKNARVVTKIAGHQAVSNRHVRETFRVLDIYIDLSDLQPDTGFLWTFEGSSTAEGADCELQFLALVNRATITRRP